MQAETATRFPYTNPFRLYVAEVIHKPSLLACVLNALYAVAASCPAGGHGCLKILFAVIRGHGATLVLHGGCLCNFEPRGV
jgi:hypothetical protein